MKSKLLLKKKSYGDVNDHRNKIKEETTKSPRRSSID